MDAGICTIVAEYMIIPVSIPSIEISQENNLTENPNAVGK
jgi:hypothetical protein